MGDHLRERKEFHALIMVSVPYVEQDVCNNSYGGAIKGTMPCAGKKGSDSCLGDRTKILDAVVTSVTAPEHPRYHIWTSD